MAEYDNSGALFKGKKAEPEHADYEGNITVAGVEYWINAWLKEGKSGQKFMSLRVKPKQKASRPVPKGMGDDIPF